ncbi:MAG TPA: TonB-dependent receptor [Flavobacterium sp.]
MNFKILLLCLIGAVCSIQAQNNAALSGKVTDKNGAPIPYASIVLKEKEKVVTGGITDDNGLFEIKNLQPLNYIVEIQFMGYQTAVRPADYTTGQKNISFGTVSLAEEANQINEVVVAERSTVEQKIDRKVINVGKDLTTAGATASEIMNNIPSVNVDQDGKLSLRGNENVRVLVDGRPTTIDPAQLLKQIPAASIKRIELITNPSAKYNPEGMSGIINIVLHKNAADGFNASINSGTTFAKTPKINNSVNMNYRTGKVNFFGTYGNNFGKHFNNGEIRRLDDESLQVIDIVNDDKSHLYKIGMDYYINDKNTVSIYTNQNTAIGRGDFKTDIFYPNSLDNLYQNSIYLSDNRNGTYNLAYKHLFKTEGETLDLEVNFNDYEDVQDVSFLTDYENPASETSAYSHQITDTRENTTVNLDYVKPISDKTNLELGAEARIIKSKNEYVTTLSPSLNSTYNYDLNIYSAYATYGQKFTKWGYQLGLRFESYEVRATNFGMRVFEDDYITVYPSASLTYTPTEKNQWQLSYSRRVDRPSLEQTKPAPEFATPLLTSVGNPELEPQFTNSVELNFTKTLEKGSVTAGIFFRKINNEITRIIYPDPTDPGNKQLMSYVNYDDNTAYGFEVSANYKITKWWDVQPSLDFSGIRQTGVVSRRIAETEDEYEFFQREVNVNALNARMNNNFRVTKSLRFLLFGFYRSGVERVQHDTEAMYKMDIGGRYTFFKDKATLSVRFNDVFNTMQSAFSGLYPNPNEGFFRWESRSVYVGLNFMFGAGKNRELQRRQRENNTNQGGGGMF